MHAVIVKFENWKMAFRKFGKFEKQSSKFWNIRKIGRGQMNGANDHNRFMSQFNAFMLYTIVGIPF